MAGLVRLRSVQKMLCRIPIVRTQQQTNLIRAVGTSNSQKSETVAAPACPKTETPTECVPETQPKKPWVSYGFNYTSEAEDKHLMNFTFFTSITILLCLGSYIYAYLPDFRMKDWAQREAYLELRRREQLGLPLIDPNYIDPSKIILPSDEELEGVEIIV